METRVCRHAFATTETVRDRTVFFPPAVDVVTVFYAAIAVEWKLGNRLKKRAEIEKLTAQFNVTILSFRNDNSNMTFATFKNTLSVYAFGIQFVREFNLAASIFNFGRGPRVYEQKLIITRGPSY